MQAHISVRDLFDLSLKNAHADIALIKLGLVAKQGENKTFFLLQLFSFRAGLRNLIRLIKLQLLDPLFQFVPERRISKKFGETGNGDACAVEFIKNSSGLAFQSWMLQGIRRPGTKVGNIAPPELGIAYCVPDFFKRCFQISSSPK